MLGLLDSIFSVKLSNNAMMGFDRSTSFAIGKPWNENPNTCCLDVQRLADFLDKLGLSFSSTGVVEKFTPEDSEGLRQAVAQSYRTSAHR